MRTYDPKSFPLVINGLLIDGFAEGTFITIEESAPGFSKVVGAYGDVTRTRSHDRSGVLRFVLQMTSPANKTLSDRYNADRDGTASGVGDLSLSDKNGDTLIEASKSYIAAMPPATFDVTPTTREWTVEIADLRMTHGGQADD